MGVGSRGLLGWYNPMIGEEGMTFSRDGSVVGFGNLLLSIINLP